MSQILVLNANPKKQSLGRALAQRYAEKVSRQHDVKVMHLAEMQFQLDLSEGYDGQQTLEPDLVAFQEAVRWSQHLVIVTPVWWGSMPAKLKALFDRTFLPGYAFKYSEGKAMPEKLLKGRTSELIITLDTPVFWYKWAQGNPIYHQLKRTILDFVGVKNKRVSYFGPVLNAGENKVGKWLREVERFAGKKVGSC